MAVQLPLPPAAWRRRTGVVIVGSGAAGLAAAVHLADAGVPALLLTRAGLGDGATALAQGGLAAVWDADDSVAEHVSDTLVAGAGLCDPVAVRELVEGAPKAIRRLIALGARFDRDAAGDYDLHLEGGHGRRRILHAGGDASGAEVVATLTRALRRAAASGSVDIVERMRAVDVLLDGSGAACGISVRQDDGTIGEFLADAVVLAVGGVGQLWGFTTNPGVATGDGLAMAYRAGAALRDVEFVQFHPTLLAVPRGDSDDRDVLVSEAVRGEGAFLVDHAGRRVMAGVHPLADLAPRDVVASAMAAHMARTGEPHLFLDARGFGAEVWAEKFPTILGLCRDRGVDPVTELIPVHPGGHYLCGGVAADLDGRTTVPGLYAVGEVAATGVQGANRLASNSVTEALVAGDRVGESVARQVRVNHPWITRTSPAPHIRTPPRLVVRQTAPLVDPAGLAALRATMDAHVGVLRTESGLTQALDDLRVLRSLNSSGSLSLSKGLDDPTLDMTNLLTVAELVTTAALARTESRGCHRRADHPDTDPAWARHIVRALDRTQLEVSA